MKRGLAVAALLLAALAGRARAEEGPATESFTLENGLRVLVHPIPAATGAFAQVLYDVGEEDDPPGMSGLAQVVAQVHGEAAAGDVVPAYEHAIGAEYDGRHELRVQDDHTIFCEGSPADRFRLVLREAAARMADLRPTSKDVAYAVAYQAWNADRVSARRGARGIAVERLHPLSGGGRRGGIAAEIRSIGPEVVVERLRRFYKPANAVLVVVGNVDPALVRAGVRRQFGPIPAGERITHHGRSVVPSDVPVIEHGDVPPPLGGLGSLLPNLGAPIGRVGGPDLAKIHEIYERLRPLAQRSLARTRGVIWGGRAGASIAVHVPPGAEGVTAAWILRHRLQAVADVHEFPPAIVLDAGGEGVKYDPDVDPSVLTLTAYSDAGEATSVEDLRRRLHESAGGEVSGTDREAVRDRAKIADDRYPCVLGTTLLRRAQTRVDGPALLAALGRLTPGSLRALADGPSVSVTLLPKEP